MLYDFLTTHHDELIRRCQVKVSLRDSPAAAASDPKRGVEVFLEQLGEALRLRQAKGALPTARSSMEEGARTATLHGKRMQEEGYSVEQSRSSMTTAMSARRSPSLRGSGARPSRSTNSRSSTGC